MDSYQKLLDISRERLQSDQFHLPREMGDISLKQTVHYAGYLNRSGLVSWPKESRKDYAKTRRANLRFLQRREVSGLKKASIVFGWIGDEDEMKALPLVASRQDSPHMWHDQQLVDYRTILKRFDGTQIRQTGHPDIYSGDAVLTGRYEKPVLSVRAYCSPEDFADRLARIERLSEDFPEAMLCVAESYKRFHLVDAGVIRVLDLKI